MTDPAEIWSEKAEENVENWGVQPPDHVILAIVEEVFEILEEMEFESGSSHEETLIHGMIQQNRRIGGMTQDLLDDFETNRDLPVEERPSVFDDVDADKAREELHDLGALLYQLDQSLDEYA